MSRYINTFGFWDKGIFVHCFFGGNKDVESLWIKICTNLAEKKQLPTRSDYENFIRDNTPKYFEPK